MEFEHTEDRRMLGDTLNRWLAAEYPMEHRQKVAYEAPFHDPDKWRELAELGVLGALVREGAGGFGGEGFDIMVVFEALGRALCPEPVLPALMAARLLEAAGESAEALIAGTTRYAVAVGELSAPYVLDDIETEALPSGSGGGGFAMSGRKSVVYGGSSADLVLVAARHGERIGVFEVEASAAEIAGYGMIDGGPAAELFLDATPARLLTEDGADALREALDAGTLALCAEAVGAMDVTNGTLLAYLKERQQFGRPIATFQVLQHRMVDLLTEIEQARSIVILAASRLSGPEGSRTVSMAKNLVGRTAKLVSEETIQMHGGIAMTWEYPASHYAKRLVMLDHQLGDTDFHLSRVMAGYSEE